MLPAVISKEQRFFPGNRKPVLEIICSHSGYQPLGSLASFSSKLLDGSPYGNAFKTRVVVHPEFISGFSYLMKSNVAPATREIAALCAEKDVIMVFNIVEWAALPGMRAASAINYGYIASKGGMEKAQKITDESTHLDVGRRAIVKNGVPIASLLCYEATLMLQNAQPGQIFIVPAYGFPASQAAHNIPTGKAFIVNDLLGKRACGEFREGDFWMKKKGGGATYFWLWE